MISEGLELGLLLYSGLVQVIPLQSNLEIKFFFEQSFIQPVKSFSSKVSLVCFQVVLAIQTHHFQTGSTFNSILATLGFKLTALANTEEFYTFKFG